MPPPTPGALAHLLFALGASFLGCTSGCSEPPVLPRTVTPAPAGAIPLGEQLCISDERFRLGDGIAESAARAWHLDRIEELGLRHLRHDLRWVRYEPRRDELHPERFDLGLSEVAARGLEMIGILDYGVPWASSQSGGDTFFPPDDPADFARHAGRMAERYGHQVGSFEIWNEQNAGFRFWKPQEDPAAYAELLHLAAAAVREARPEAQVIYGGLFFHDQAITGATDFLRAHLAAHPHAGEDFDALSFHPYPLYPASVAPEVADKGEVPVEDMVIELRSLLDEHQLAPPLVVTEYGWPAFYPVTPELQATYLAREALWLMAGGVELACWFTLIDGPSTGGFPPEDDFGLFAWDVAAGEIGEAKPAWYAMHTLASELGPLSFVRHAEHELALPGGSYALLLADATGETWAHALWSFDERFAGEVVVPQPEGAVFRAVDALGAEVPVVGVEEGVRVPFGPLPVYLLGHAG